MPYAYFLVGLMLCTLILAVNAHLMSGISKFPSYSLVICIALLLVEELSELTTLPYFLVGHCTVLLSLLTTKPSLSLSLPNVEPRLAILFNFRRIVLVLLH